MMKNKKTTKILLAIFSLFVIFSVIGSVSACIVYEPNYEIDHGSKKIKTTNYNAKITWDSYKYNDTDKVAIFKEYTTVNKKTKTKVSGTSSVILEKISKNKLKISNSFTTGPNDKSIKYIKTNLSAKSYYWLIYEQKYLKKTEKQMFTKTYLIDHGSKEKNTELVKTNNSYRENIKFGWKAYAYNNFGQILVKQLFTTHNIHDGENKSDLIFLWPNFYEKEITLNKVSKNKLKITIHTLSNYLIKDRCISTNSKNMVKDLYNNKIVKESTKVIYVKTKLSSKNYYKKYYKKQMIKEFLK